ncbi:MAG: c-type cytochrome [Acidobacteriota bacterium]|nr:c-type cytochrome [Acidobacteriota bacterium]
MHNKVICTLSGAFLIASIVLCPGCTANKKPSSIEYTLANVAKDVVIPIEAHNVKNPVPSSDEAVKAGQQIYLQSCALCHGTDGHGYTNLGRGLYPPAMDLTSPHVQHWSDADLFWIIQNGIRLTGMPSWKSTIPATDTWKIAQFIHALPRLNAQAVSAASAPAPPSLEQQAQLIAYGKTLYRQEGCFMCHQLDGQGGKVGPDLTSEGTRGRTDAWLIGHFKDPSAYTRGSIMPSFKNLTQTQLQALTLFLQRQKGAAK